MVFERSPFAPTMPLDIVILPLPYPIKWLFIGA